MGRTWLVVAGVIGVAIVVSPIAGAILTVAAVLAWGFWNQERRARDADGSDPRVSEACRRHLAELGAFTARVHPILMTVVQDGSREDDFFEVYRTETGAGRASFAVLFRWCTSVVAHADVPVSQKLLPLVLGMFRVLVPSFEARTLGDREAVARVMFAAMDVTLAPANIPRWAFDIMIGAPAAPPTDHVPESAPASGQRDGIGDDYWK